MNIAVDAFPLMVGTASGIPNYVRNTLLRLLAIDRENQYFLYCRNPFKFEDYNNLAKRFSTYATDTSSSYGNTLWLFSQGVRLMRRDKIDIFWGTRQMLPPYLPGGIKKVLVSYDLVWHYFPETMETYNRLVSSVFFRRSIKSSDHIITISEASARSLRDVLEVEPDKISIAYPAADYCPLDKDGSAKYISEKYGTQKEYILTVGTVEPRKNLSFLMTAISGLRGKGYQLLIAGASGWKTSALHSEYERLGLTEKEVKFLGYIPDCDMNRLYSGARLFLFPSVYEGFGIPPLEAMASGTPVIASNASSLPEVTGNPQIQLSPHDIEGWRDMIVNVMSDSELQNRMIVHGLERNKLFSWEESARRTLKVFEDVFK